MRVNVCVLWCVCCAVCAVRVVFFVLHADVLCFTVAIPHTPAPLNIRPVSTATSCHNRNCSCRLYDEHGLVLETSTHLEDIVMSDYFQIDDRCVVQPGRKGSVRVDVEVEVREMKPP